MQLSVEILDRIFGFLVLHETLFACSKDPILSPIVERHLYHDVIVQIFGTPDPDLNNTFELEQLSRLVSENPRILYYVRNLQIQVQVERWVGRDVIQGIRERLDKFAETLLMFPILECIMLTSTPSCLWYWTDNFQAALEDRLNLPTLTEVHLVGSKGFPSSLLDKCKNIKNLSLSTVDPFSVAENRHGVSDPTFPKLKSLTLRAHPISSSLQAWLECHVSELQSLTCLGLPASVLPELLGACSETLNNLELNLTSQYSSKHIFRTGEIQIKHFPEIPVIPKNLQQLIIYTEVDVGEDDNPEPTDCTSSLPALAEAINTFIPSLRHLILYIDVNLFSFSDFTKIDFSPLAILGVVPRTDLFINTGIAPAALTLAQLMSLLGDDESIVRSIQEGRLVVHSEKVFQTIK